MHLILKTDSSRVSPNVLIHSDVCSVWNSHNQISISHHIIIFTIAIFFFQFIFLGQPHVQISIVSGSPTDSPLIRFLPIFLTDCPISFQYMFETTQTYFLAGLIKSKPDFYFGSDFSKIQGKHYICGCTVNVCLLT